MLDLATTMCPDNNGQFNIVPISGNRQPSYLISISLEKKDALTILVLVNFFYE